MVTITSVTQRGKEDIEETFKDKPGITFTEYHENYGVLYTIELEYGVIKCFCPDSSIVIKLGGRIVLLEGEDYGELRFC